MLIFGISMVDNLQPSNFYQKTDWTVGNVPSWVWKLFRENMYSGCRIWLSPSTNTVKNVECRSISWSRKVDIEIFITKRPLLTHQLPSKEHYRLIDRFNYLHDPNISCYLHIKSVVQAELRLTFLAILILIISNIENNKIHRKSPFFRASCRRTETPTKDRKTKGTSSISIFSSRVWTNIFWCTVLEITATQSTDFVTAKNTESMEVECVRVGLQKCLCFASH